MAIDDVNNFSKQMRNALERVSKANENGKITDADTNDIRRYGLGQETCRIQRSKIE